MMDRQLEQQAMAWRDADLDPETRAEVEGLIASKDEAGLAERFTAPLEFGTAGLRGIVGAGPGRMNRAVVVRTTRALADYLLGHARDARTLPVVVGRDARLSSPVLFDDTVRVLSAAGIPVRYFESPVPTPLVAFAAKELSANAAVIITASHNPPEYNGYKLYGDSAVQIVSPLDETIARGIEAVGAAKDVPGAVEGARAVAEATPIPDSIGERYLAEIGTLRRGGSADRSLRIVYTPLHGVGGRWMCELLARAGYDNVAVVPDQAEPDGKFPTVAFPNPEEPGALDQALAISKEQGADLILANDPDADRLGVSVPTPSGRFITLSGNQIGCLLLDWALSGGPFPAPPLTLASIVSSPLADVIARAHGARHEWTLTGFKWIWTAALSILASERRHFVFGYEEALGYCVGPWVRDKDGISAALAFAELSAEARAGGASVLERLGALYRKHGLWTSAQTSVKREGLSGAKAIAAAVDQAGATPPGVLGGERVIRITDFRAGAEDRPAWLGTTPLIQLDLESGGRILVRPSGTEPKLKIYVDLPGKLGEDGAWLDAERQLAERCRALGREVAGALGLGD